MRVEILEERISDTDPATGRHYAQSRGDVVTVPDDVGRRWCAYGWAKDLDGKVETGERIPGTRDVHGAPPPEKTSAGQPLSVQKSTLRGRRK